MLCTPPQMRIRTPPQAVQLHKGTAELFERHSTCRQIKASIELALRFSLGDSHKYPIKRELQPGHWTFPGRELQSLPSPRTIS